MKIKYFVDVKIVKIIMKVKNISLKNLAIRIGISEQEVAAFLDGANQEQMNMDRLFAIANALDVLYNNTA